MSFSTLFHTLDVTAFGRAFRLSFSRLIVPLECERLGGDSTVRLLVSKVSISTFVSWETYCSPELEHMVQSF